MNILVSGFKPFLGETLNPSEKIVTEIVGLDRTIRTLILPVEFKKSFDLLRAEITKKSPDYLLMLGQATGRKDIALEKVALNWVQTIHQDEAGKTPKTDFIKKGDPLALMTSFPVDIIFEKLKKQKFPVEISFSAGTFVCNDLYYRVLSEFPKLKAIFIHLPLVTEQLTPADVRPGLSYEQQLLTVKNIVHLLRKLKL